MRPLYDNEVARLRAAPADWGKLTTCPWGPAIVVLEQRGCVEVKLVEETWLWKITEHGAKILQAALATRGLDE